MERKIVSALMLTLLLTSMLASAFDIRPVEASGTIYIRTDGSIDPPTAPIFTADNITYTFTGDITDSIVVERNNTILDGNGFTLQGSESGHGVQLDSVSGVTLMGMNIQGFDYGIYLHSSSNNIITGNTISYCAPYSIGLYWSSFNFISHNNIADNIYTGGSGITIHTGSNNNKVTQNIIENHDDYGIVLWGSTPPRYNEVYENNITDCRYIGIRLERGPNYVFRNHLRNNGVSIAGYVAYDNSICENYIENSKQGIVLTQSSRYNTVSVNVINNCTYGIAIYSQYLATSHTNYIFGNKVRHGDVGLRCSGQDNRFYHNNVFDYVEPAFSSGIGNVWDDGYPSGGNYWSNYSGTDLFSGPYQNETGGDGLGDTPYFIPFDSQDNYPLMYPWDGTESWTFAIITDLHIGRGYPDYGGQGWNDAGTNGQDYYLTDRLKESVDWILRNRIRYDIRFVMVLGDIAETAEYSEFDKAKSILSRLDDPDSDPTTNDATPYVPVIGNHDVYSYTEDEENPRPESDIYFRQIFIEERLSLLSTYFDNWQSPDITEEITFHSENWIVHLQNYAFNYEGVKFVCLDFVTRKPIPWGGTQPEAALYSKTEDWLNSALVNGETTILFSHHPFERCLANSFSNSEMDEIGAIIQDSGAYVELHFAGHIHGFNNMFGGIWKDANNEFRGLSNLPSVTTEAVMVSGNDVSKEAGVKGIVRLVTVTDNMICYDSYRAECELPALNPYLYRLSPKLTGIGNSVVFEIYPFQSGRTFDYSCDWGDGTPETTGQSSTRALASHFYVNAGTFTVNLTVSDADDPSLVETITHPVEVDIDFFPAYLIASAEHVILTLANGVNVAENPQNTAEYVMLMVSHSEPICVASMLVHFEKATDNIDLSQATVDANLTERKSIVYMPVWPQELEESQILFIPSTGVGAVYVCLNATSLDEVSYENADFIINVGETKNNLTVATTYYNGQGYYLVYGNVTNLAGGEIFRDVAITGMILPKTIVGQGFDLPVSVTIQNQGYLTENFNLTIWANTTLIGSATNVSLTSGSYTTIVLSWNTSGIPFGNYTISAKITAVPHEENMDNNTFADGIITVTIPGDVDGDFEVGTSDLFDLEVAYGSTYGSPTWNANCDINGDIKVDVIDLFIQSKNYGESVP